MEGCKSRTAANASDWLVTLSGTRYLGLLNEELVEYWIAYRLRPDVRFQVSVMDELDVSYALSPLGAEYL